MTAVEDATLTPRGELCEDTIHAFRDALLATEGAVVVDLRDVSIFSAAAMRVVVQARAKGIDVTLVNPSGLTARALAAVGFDALVTGS